MVRLLGKAVGRGVTEYKSAKSDFLLVNLGNVGFAVSHVQRRYSDDMPLEFHHVFASRAMALEYVEGSVTGWDF